MGPIEWLKVLDIAVKGYQWITSTGDDGNTILIYGEDTDGDGTPDTDVLEYILPQTEATIEKSIIIMSADGTMTVYDEGGNITAEDCDTAYSLWVSENGIMDKSLDNYSVTEGLLLCVLLMGAFYFIKSLFRKKDVFR